MENYKARIASLLKRTALFRLVFGRPNKPSGSVANQKWVTENIAQMYEQEEIVEQSVLYESFHGDSISDAPLAIYKYLSRQEKYSGYTHIFAINEAGSVPDSVKAAANTKFVTLHSRDYASALVRCKYLVNNSTFPNYFRRRKGQVYINTWHGIPLKKMFMDEGSSPTVHKNSARNFLQASHLMFPNKYTADRLLSSAGVKEILPASVTENAGFRPYLMGGADSKLEKEKLGIPISKKVILYAPTWRGVLHNSVSNEDAVIEAAEKISGAYGDEYEVVVSVHSMAKEHFDAAHSKVTIFPSEFEINEFLSCVDILVSDYSSILFDFIPTKRSMILYAYDKEEYEDTRGFYFDLSEFPAQVCQTVDELLDCIGNVRGENDRPEYPADSPFYISRESSKIGPLLDPIFDEGDVAVELPDKKNVLIYLGGFRSNGISTSAINLSKHFNYEDSNLIVMTSGADIDKDVEKQRILSRLDSRCTIVHQSGPMLFTLSEKALYQKFRQAPEISESEQELLKQCFLKERVRRLGLIEIDTAIDFSGYSIRWALLIAFSGAKRAVIYQHNDMYSESLTKPHFNEYFHSLFATYRYFDKIFSVSEPTMEQNRKNISQIYPELKGKFDFVHNCISPEELIVDSRKVHLCELDGKKYLPVNLVDKKGVYGFNAIPFPDPSALNFISIGRFSAEKDHEKLIKAFAKFQEDRPNTVLYLVGEGELEARLHRQIRRLGIDHKVVFTGQIDNPFPLMSLCDCFVLPSNYEGQPMVLLEALCLNMPVIATDTPGSRSVLKGRYGKLVEISVDGVYQGMLDFVNGEVNSGGFTPDLYVKETNKMFSEKVLNQTLSIE